MKKSVNGIVIECVQGDICSQPDIEAVVNAANAELISGGGVAGAIHRKAGAKLTQACRIYAPIKPGHAVITGAYGLPNKYVIHCLGPVYGRDAPAGVLLANCYRNALSLAQENNIRSIAFPAISAGVFGYPMAEAAGVAFSVVIEESLKMKALKLIRFVLYNERYLAIHEQVLTEFLRGREDEDKKGEAVR